MNAASRTPVSSSSFSTSTSTSTSTFYTLVLIVALLLHTLLAAPTTVPNSTAVKLGNELLRADNYAVLKGHRVKIYLSYHIYTNTNFILLL